MAAREYGQVTVLDKERSFVFTVGSEGLSTEDQEALVVLMSRMIRGEIDTLNLIPGPAVVIDEKLRALVEQQISDVLVSESYKKGTHQISMADGYTVLHADSLHDTDMKPIMESGVRIHFTNGVSVRDGNIPAGYKENDFDPYFVLGRMGEYEYAPNGHSLSRATFQPCVIVDQKNPVWTVFRNTGSFEGPNFPVAHTCIPKKVLDVMMDPTVNWSEFDEASSQVATTETTSLIVTSDSYAPISGVPYITGIFARGYTALDHYAPGIERSYI